MIEEMPQEPLDTTSSTLPKVFKHLSQRIVSSRFCGSITLHCMNGRVEKIEERRITKVNEDDLKHG